MSSSGLSSAFYDRDVMSNHDEKGVMMRDVWRSLSKVRGDATNWSRDDGVREETAGGERERLLTW